MTDLSNYVPAPAERTVRLIAAFEPSVTEPAHGGRSRTERVIERCVIVFAQSMVVLGVAVAVYGFLVLMFFACCGFDTITYFHPSRSPLGPAMTVLVIWPLVGLVCVALQGGPGELLDIVGRAVQRIIGRMRPRKET